jgi:hypothetical protein
VDSSVQIDSAGVVIDDDVITKLVEPALVRRDDIWVATRGSEPRRWDGNEELQCLDS